MNWWQLWPRKVGWAQGLASKRPHGGSFSALCPLSPTQWASIGVSLGSTRLCQNTKPQVSSVTVLNTNNTQLLAVNMFNNKSVIWQWFAAWVVCNVCANGMKPIVVYLRGTAMRQLNHVTVAFSYFSPSVSLLYIHQTHSITNYTHASIQLHVWGDLDVLGSNTDVWCGVHFPVMIDQSLTHFWS